jgi:putative acetyltransferase
LFIRESGDADLNALLKVAEEAFGEKEGPEIATLINDLLNDPTAKPLLSLIAIEEGEIVGHILFTKARLFPDSAVKPSILAPLAVKPEKQRRGVGGRLIAEGLKRLSQKGVKLVFVLGHPEYYPIHGFRPAGVLGFEAPYPIPDEVADAWMVQELHPGVIGKVKGKVICADTMNRPKYWRE